MTIRPAQEADLATVIDLYRKYPPLPLPLRELDAESRNVFRIRTLQRHGVKAPFHVLLTLEGDRPVGYLGYLSNQIDSTTLEPQARICETGGEGFPELLQAAMGAARRSGADFLIYLVEQGQTDRETDLQQAGFMVESRRIAKRFLAPTLTDQGRQAWPTYRARAARPDDLFSIALLCTESGDQYVPAGRKVDLLAVKGRYMDNHLSTVLDESLCLLVAESQQDDELVGYMKIRLCVDQSASAEVIGYIEDFSVRAQHRGAASHVLFFGVEEALHARGVHVLVGDISADNGRSLAGATRKVNLGIESQRWGRHL